MLRLSSWAHVRFVCELSSLIEKRNLQVSEHVSWSWWWSKSDNYISLLISFPSFSVTHLPHKLNESTKRWRRLLLCRHHHLLLCRHRRIPNWGLESPPSPQHEPPSSQRSSSIPSISPRYLLAYFIFFIWWSIVLRAEQKTSVEFCHNYALNMYQVNWRTLL